jgi:hypothetical protein
VAPRGRRRQVESPIALPVYYPPAIWEPGLRWLRRWPCLCPEANTGRLLWRFRAVRPALDPVFDKLISTWPVAGAVRSRHPLHRCRHRQL